MEDSSFLGTSDTPRLIPPPEVAKEIYRICLVQLIFGFLIVCGMALYLGLILGEMRRGSDYVGNSCYLTHGGCDDFITIDIIAIVIGIIVSFSRIFFPDKNIYL